jgi:large repetitive protein
MLNHLIRTAKSAKVATLVALLGVLVAGGSAAAKNDPVPAPTITSSPPARTNATTASFSFTDSKAGVTFQCSLDNGAFASCTSPKAYSSLGQGSHTFRVRAVSGSSTSSATEYSWVVDTTPPPAPSITSSPGNPSEAGTQSFSFSDAESGVTFQCALDGGAFAACTSPKSYPTVAPGTHTFAVKARDAAGNLSSATSYGWTVQPATPTITAKPSDPSNQTGASFSFTDTTAGVSFQCSLDGVAYAACSSPKTYSSLGQGSHTFRVRAVSGAYASNPATYSWTVDTVPPPAPTIFSQPADPSSSTNPTFEFIDAELDATYQCRLDSGVWETCLMSKSYSGLSQGQHTFSVRARDGAGNIGPAASVTWTIDSVPPPQPVLTQRPDDPSPSANGTFAWTDAEAGVSFQCQLDGDAWTSCTSPRTVTVVGNGQHEFDVRARDAAGNLSDAASYKWKVSETVDFTITGSPDGVLAPGLWRSLPLQITNPNNFTIYLASLEVVVTSSPAGCPASTNVEIQQSGASSSQSVAVPANGTAVVPPALRPRIRLKNLAVNQDACKNKTFGLTYNGSATK